MAAVAALRDSQVGHRVERRCWRILHNCVVHPLMEVLPEDLGNLLHDTTGYQVFDKQYATDGREPVQGINP